MGLDRFCLRKTTLLDFPGEVAATVFTLGCNLRCPYCHNPELVEGPVPADAIDLDKFKAFLKKRKNVLGGVCITGGEPLLHKDLPLLIDLIKSCGLKVKIDTNGTFPKLLKEIQPDYIAMDIKTSPDKYHLVGLKNPDCIRESSKWIIQSGIRHEFRTTLVPRIAALEDVPQIAALIRGGNLYVLAGFRPGVTLEKEYAKTAPYSPETLDKFLKAFTAEGINTRIRAN